MAAEKAIEILKSTSIDASMKDKDLLEKIAVTAMTGKLADSPDNKIAKYAVDLALNATEDYNGKIKFDMDKVNVEKKVGRAPLIRRWSRALSSTRRSYTRTCPAGSKTLRSLCFRRP
jgi:hypothetical protein